jgi:hypothetical protein
MHRLGSYGDGLESAGEIPEQKFVDSVNWMLGDADQNLAEISFRVHSVQLMHSKLKLFP